MIYGLFVRMRREDLDWESWGNIREDVRVTLDNLVDVYKFQK